LRDRSPIRESLTSASAIARHCAAGVGYDAVDLAAATDASVAVTIAPGTNQDAVAEHTFALILAIAKNLVPQHLGTCALQWPRQANLPLRGRTLGIAVWAASARRWRFAASVSA